MWTWQGLSKKVFCFCSIFDHEHMKVYWPSLNHDRVVYKDKMANYVYLFLCAKHGQSNQEDLPKLTRSRASMLTSTMSTVFLSQKWISTESSTGVISIPV